VTDIWLFRHGETQWNRQKLYQGQKNSDLTEKGIRDITVMAEQIREVQFASAYCSPLGRTRQTLELLAPRTGTIRYDHRIQEISLGEMEGRPFDSLAPDLNEADRRFWEEPENFRAPGGESLREVQLRVEDFIRQILRESGPVLVVTHTVPVRIFLNRFLRRELPRFWEEPAIPAGSLIRIQGEPPEIRSILSPESPVATGRPL